jgi:signal peptidase I
MSMNVPLLLTILTLFTGGVYAFDKLYYQKKHPNQASPWWIDYPSSFFFVFFLVLVLRSFAYEPFRIPSGSLEPTLLVGDFILVSKYDYGLRLPVLHSKVVKVGEPQRGDIVVFRYPVNPSEDYIKRFVGLPGDTIAYKNKQLFVNGKLAPQKLIGYAMDGDSAGDVWKVEVREENLNGVKHRIYIRPDVAGHDFTIKVPAGKYFAMGDNRDDSSDSRVWGFVPEFNIIGKAVRIWMSWNAGLSDVRWGRIGKSIH